MIKLQTTRTVRRKLSRVVVLWHRLWGLYCHLNNEYWQNKRRVTHHLYNWLMIKNYKWCGRFSRSQMHLRHSIRLRSAFKGQRCGISGRENLLFSDLSSFCNDALRMRIWLGHTAQTMAMSHLNQYLAYQWHRMTCLARDSLTQSVDRLTSAHHQNRLQFHFHVAVNRLDGPRYTCSAFIPPSHRLSSSRPLLSTHREMQPTYIPTMRPPLWAIFLNLLRGLEPSRYLIP